MTEEDLKQIRSVVSGEIAASEQRTGAAIAGAEQRTSAAIGGAIAEAEQRTSAAIAAAEERASERSRDMQTEILRGLEAFARGNFSRMHRIETSDADTNARISALEERVLYLETRRPLQ